VEQPRLPLRAEALSQRQHAEDAGGIAEKQGVVWLTINSGAPGMQGHMNGMPRRPPS
jgi:hypothetical protein